MTDVVPDKSTEPHLARTLGLWAIVGLGLGYMTPTVVFDTFGIVADETGGIVPTAYVLALVAMLLTAISYGRMTRVFPTAGSAYTYTSETMSPNVGFVVGWSSLLDYLLLPLVNALIIRSYMESFFPSVPAWIWVVAYVPVITALVVHSVHSTSRINMILVVFEVVLIAVFLVLAAKALAGGDGAGTVFSSTPWWNESSQIGLAITGATIVCFSFIGFDAITMYTEEAKDPAVVPRAIILALLIGGAIFLVSAVFAQSLFPSVSDFSPDSLENSALPEIAFNVGGTLFKILLTSAAFAATVASSLASHASVARLLYVMGRNGRGPVSRTFGAVHPRFLTPANATVFVGAVSLLAIPVNLDFVASLINFGALIAFSFVNLAVIVYFARSQGRVGSAGEVGRNVVLPLLGLMATLVLWWFLSAESRTYGFIWLGIGVALVVWLTRFFTRPLQVSLEER